jgi:glycosyltransferase involved in cell wall biosynthesis
MMRRFRLPAQVWRQPSDAFWWLSDRSSALGSALNVPHFAERLRSGVDALNQADALIAPSQYLADVYARYGVDPGKIRVWRQGVDMDRCLLRTESPALRVAYLGQVKYHKGVDLLLDAWSALHSPVPRNLVIYGSDKGEQKYGERIRRQLAGLDGATWAEPFPREEIWSVLSNLDVIVIPSRWVENSPNVILEAQAAGVVVVGTDLGGVAEMVRHGENGLLFEPDNAADLAAQLQRLLDDPTLLPHLRSNPPPFQSHITEVEQIESLYESLVPSQTTLTVTTGATV